jgi:hypothetical protein
MTSKPVGPVMVTLSVPAHVLLDYRTGARHSLGRGFEGGTWLVQSFTSRFSAAWFQVFQKSACMVEAPQGDASLQASVTLPGVAGMGKITFMLSTGTDMGWERGHRTLPSRLPLQAMCDLWFALSSRGLPFGATATQSGKTMRKPSFLVPHLLGGFRESFRLSAHLQLMCLALEVITFRPAGKGLTRLWSLPPGSRRRRGWMCVPRRPSF